MSRHIVPICPGAQHDRGADDLREVDRDLLGVCSYRIVLRDASSRSDQRALASFVDPVDPPGCAA
jgi:hypothetical protein